MKAREEGDRMRWLDSITGSMDMNLSRLQGIIKDRRRWCATVHKVRESDMNPQLNNNTNVIDRI